MKKGRKNYFDLLSDYFFNRFNMDSFDIEPNKIDFKDYTSNNEGTLEVTTGENEHGLWERREWTSADGKSRMTSYVMKSIKNNDEITKEDLKKELKLAVEKEDYELASKIKKRLDSL